MRSLSRLLSAASAPARSALAAPPALAVLAGLDRLGLEPPRASLLLSWASTLLLWGLVVAFAARWAPRRGAAWAVVVPALFLAANRSFAVWASSGLETRAFELCVVAGTLTL